MSVSHRYRNFGGPKGSDAPKANDTSEDDEDQKLQAFEAGYQAGWDDATKAQAEEKQKTAAELSQTLQDMAFSYQEALSKLTVSMEPIVQEIVEKLLPEVLRPVVGTHIAEQINGLMKDQVSGQVEIVVNSDNLSVVQEMMDHALPAPFDLVTDDTLSDGQAFIRFADAERQVDMDAVIEEIGKAMAGFFHDAAQRGENG